jgi:hypothetical protein
VPVSNKTLLNVRKLFSSRNVENKYIMWQCVSTFVHTSHLKLLI